MILHCVEKLIFVHRAPRKDAQSLIREANAFRRSNKRADVVTSGESLPNNLLSGSASRSEDKEFHQLGS
jgi:hypothetical protein